MTPRSLGDLTRTLTIIGLAGWLLLILTILVNLGLWVEMDGIVLPPGSALLDLDLLVLIPFTVTIVAIVGVCRWQVARYSTMLDRRSEEIGRWDVRRGLRLDLQSLPSELKGYGDAINGLLARLEDVALKRELFAVQVAHELKNPMAILLIELERLNHPAAARLAGDVRSMSRLLDQLLMLARLQAHATMSLEKRPVDLVELAAGIIAGVAPQALSERRVVEMVEMSPVEVLGQPELIGAAIRNLIDNALRVTPEGGKVTIIVGPGPCVAVADGGPGLDARRFEALCQPFVQANGASRTGAGLGLAIVHETVRLHGGSLRTEPEARRIVLTIDG